MKVTKYYKLEMVESAEYYDVEIKNPTAEEKKILDSITFKEKNEYRYKVESSLFIN